MWIVSSTLVELQFAQEASYGGTSFGDDFCPVQMEVEVNQFLHFRICFHRYLLVIINGLNPDKSLRSPQKYLQIHVTSTTMRLCPRVMRHIIR